MNRHNLRNIQPTLSFDEKQGVKIEDIPDDLPEPARPPLRHIDQYVKAECPCLSQRYTVAVLTCIGFIISFGMRCNMGMAKLQFEHFVSKKKIEFFSESKSTIEGKKYDFKRKKRKKKS